MTWGEKIVASIEAHCKIPEGAYVGQSIKLMKFQQLFVPEVYDEVTGTNRTHLSVALKDRKSALIAVILLTHIVGPLLWLILGAGLISVGSL